MALGINFNPKRFHKSQIKFYIVLIPFCLFMGLPIVYILLTSLKPTDELFLFPPRFFVQNPTLRNYKELFSTSGLGSPMTTYLINSIIVTSSVVVLSVLFSSMAGYILSKKHFKGKNFIFEVNKISLMFVSVAVMIPRFLVVSKIGIVDTMFAHILPLIAIPVGLFLIKQFVDQIPDELVEAAKIDGAGDFFIYLKIILPLIKPALATVAILAFQTAWNNIETSKLFVNTESKQTLAYYMSTLVNSSNSVAGAGWSAAATTIMFLPNLIIFIILQNKVMSTMAHSGIK